MLDSSLNSTFISNIKKKKILLGFFLVVALWLAYIGWYNLLREVPQGNFATPEERFKYATLGAEDSSGLPYWVFMVMPRMFPEYLPGPGGYASLGIPWELGNDVPIGFSKKTVGFLRITNNCAVCHVSSYREKKDQNPVFVVGGPGHTTNVQAFFRFLTDCARDPRFNADNILTEIQALTELSITEQLLYRFLIIPFLKKRILERNFDWMEIDGLPDWGNGRDDPMNLTKYFMLEMEQDGSFGPADMPSIWNLQKYKEGMALNWDGASYDSISVLIDSALGLGASPDHPFMDKMNWLNSYLKKLPSPTYPFKINSQKAEKGKVVFDAQCASCHASDKTGHPMPVAEIGTSDERLKSWNKEAAIQANIVTSKMGIKRRGLVEKNLIGYVAAFLDGIWLRGPYLHNGSVPTLNDLLSPASDRPKVFYRGYDVYDQVNVGFVTQGDDAERVGTVLDTSQRGNANRGHEFGTTLSNTKKMQLLEYLKTL